MADRATSKFDIAPAAVIVPTATLNRNAILAALTALGVPEDHGKQVVTAIVAGRVPYVSYTGA